MFGHDVLYVAETLTSSCKQTCVELKSLLQNATDRFHSRDKNFDNRCYAAILVYRNVKKLVASFAWNMVLGLLVSCGSKSG